MFGQYAPAYTGRRSLRDMRAAATSKYGADQIASTRKLENNTIEIVLKSGVRIIRLHETDILRISPSGMVTIDTKGWQTVTTKARLNTYLPAGWSVFSDRGWFIRTPADTYPFVDGVSFTADGHPLPEDARMMRRLAAQGQLDRKRISTFVDKLAKHGWSNPGGDPWLPANGQLYDAVVVRDWLKTGYVTRLVVVNALRWAGYSEIRIGMIMRAVERGEKLAKHDLSPVRRFLKACVGLER